MNLLYRVFKPKIEPEVLKCYMEKLPDVINVGVTKDKNGKYWAEIEVDQNTLFTEANSRDKLEENVNKAIACFYEVKREYIPYLLINKRYYDPILKKEKVLRTA